MLLIVIVVVRNASNICVFMYVYYPLVVAIMLLLVLVNLQLLAFQVFGCICFLATESVVQATQKPKVNGKGGINPHTSICTHT